MRMIENPSSCNTAPYSLCPSVDAQGILTHSAGKKAKQYREKSWLQPSYRHWTVIEGKLSLFPPWRTSNLRQKAISCLLSFFFKKKKKKERKNFKLYFFSNYLFKIISLELPVYPPLKVVICVSCTVCALQGTKGNHTHKDYAHFVVPWTNIMCVCVRRQITQNLGFFRELDGKLLVAWLGLSFHNYDWNQFIQPGS